MLNIEISDAVGSYSNGSRKPVKNNASDQGAIEFLLNSIDVKNGGTSRKVKKGTGQVVTYRQGYNAPTDGTCDRTLASAIQHFQHANYPKCPIADGVVDRSGQTIKLLNKLAVMTFGPEEIFPPAPDPTPPKPPEPGPSPKPKPAFIPSVGPFFNLEIKNIKKAGANGVTATVIFDVPPASRDGGFKRFEYQFEGQGDEFDDDSESATQFVSIGKENANAKNPFAGMAVLKRTHGVIFTNYALTCKVNGIAGPEADRDQTFITMPSPGAAFPSTRSAIGTLTLVKASKSR